MSNPLEVTLHFDAPAGQPALDSNKGILFDNVPNATQSKGSTISLDRLSRQVGISQRLVTYTPIDTQLRVEVPRGCAAILFKSSLDGLVQSPKTELIGPELHLLQSLLNEMTFNPDFNLPPNDLRLIFEALWPGAREVTEYYLTVLGLANSDTTPANQGGISIWGYRIYKPHVQGQSDGGDVFLSQRYGSVFAGLVFNQHNLANLKPLHPSVNLEHLSEQVVAAIAPNNPHINVAELIEEIRQLREPNIDTLMAKLSGLIQLAENPGPQSSSALPYGLIRVVKNS